MPMALFEGMDESPAFSRNRKVGEGPSHSLERAEVARAVRMAIAALKGRQRIAVELQCDDHSYNEIAVELDMTAKAAKSLLYRARNELRITLTPFAESLS
jgi:RNA polymerase sigma-70 factor (ECF subfamily)